MHIHMYSTAYLQDPISPSGQFHLCAGTQKKKMTNHEVGYTSMLEGWLQELQWPTSHGSPLAEWPECSLVYRIPASPCAHEQPHAGIAWAVLNPTDPSLIHLLIIESLKYTKPISLDLGKYAEKRARGSSRDCVALQQEQYGPEDPHSSQQNSSASMHIKVKAPYMKHCTNDMAIGSPFAEAGPHWISVLCLKNSTLSESSYQPVGAFLHT